MYASTHARLVRHTHQGMSRGDGKMDCTHYCYSPLFFEPLLARRAVLRMM